MQRRLPTHELDQQVEAERARLRTLPTWEIAHKLITLAESSRSLTPIERKALMYESASRLRGTGIVSVVS